MKYGWDKIKVVTDNLSKGDNLQALWFDTCWYLLIWKWSNEYWTQWDPLMSDEVPCWSEANCPNCQPKITDVMDLPGRPEPCNEWDAILALSHSGRLKTICESQWEDKDRKVAVSDNDEIPWHLKDKLIVCDNNWPLSFTENEQWNFHTYCLNWDPTKANLKFIDLKDTPNNYSSPGLLYSDWNWISYLEPNVCEDSDFAYIVFNKRTWSFDTVCDNDMSYALWYFDWGNVNIPVDTEWVRIYATNYNDQSAWEYVFNWRWHLAATNDIKNWTWTTLFYITKPWVYTITCNSTLRNLTEAWLQAARWWLLIVQWWQEYEWTDFKYDSRWYTRYVNDFYPNQPDPDYIHDSWIGWWLDERNLELSIMSFNTTHTIVADWVSEDNPMWIWFWVRCSTYLHDHRMDDSSSEPLESVLIWLTWWETTVWPKTRITCLRNWSIPPTYKSRF